MNDVGRVGEAPVGIQVTSNMVKKMGKLFYLKKTL